MWTKISSVVVLLLTIAYFSCGSERSYRLFLAFQTQADKLSVAKVTIWAIDGSAACEDIYTGKVGPQQLTTYSILEISFPPDSGQKLTSVPAKQVLFFAEAQDQAGSKILRACSEVGVDKEGMGVVLQFMRFCAPTSIEDIPNNQLDDDCDGLTDECSATDAATAQGGECRECEEGPCCDENGYYKDSSAGRCHEEKEYRCVPNNCGSNREHRSKFRYCSGASAKCDGEWELTHWEAMEACEENQICELDVDSIAQCQTCDHPLNCVEGECGCSSAGHDSDGDNTPDCNDLCPDDGDKIDPGICGCGVSDIDSNSDGTPDCQDPDADGDGWSNTDEVDCSTDPFDSDSFPADVDEDGVCDNLDLCYGNNASGNTDGDNTCNNIDTDDDADGYSDTDETDCSTDPLDPNSIPIDGDEDGVCDYLDTCLGDDATNDTDDDGICDSDDVCVGDDSSGDADGDGVCDSDDPCPADNPDDTDGDEICDSVDTCVDVDADGFGNGTNGNSGCVTTTTDCDDDPLACGTACSPNTLESKIAGNCSDTYDNDCDTAMDMADLGCGYAYRKSITIDCTKAGKAGAPQTLADFPLLFSTTDVNLKTTDADSANGRVANSNGYDIVFRSFDAFTCGGAPPCDLAHELELYDGDNGTITAWIRIPALRGNTAECTNTVIFVDYGNPNVVAPTEAPASVWDANYAAVWHLSDDPSLSSDCDEGAGTMEVCDSTSNGNNGDSRGSMTSDNLVAGAVAGAVHFDGFDDELFIPGNGSMGNMTTLTISAWIAPVSWGEGGFGRIFCNLTDSNDGGYEVLLDAESPDGRFLLRSHRTASHGVWSSHKVIKLNQWNHIAVTYDIRSDDNDPLMYVNGGLVGMYDSNPSGLLDTDTEADVHLGARRWSDRWFEGALDEIRVSRAQRSEHWIGATYNNQRWPDDKDYPGEGFYVVGVESYTD